MKGKDEKREIKLTNLKMRCNYNLSSRTICVSNFLSCFTNYNQNNCLWTFEEIIQREKANTYMVNIKVVFKFKIIYFIVKKNIFYTLFYRE